MFFGQDMFNHVDLMISSGIIIALPVAIGGSLYGWPSAALFPSAFAKYFQDRFTRSQDLDPIPQI